MSAKPDDKRRLKLAAQGLRKTAISLQAAVVSLLQTADALSAETDDTLVENSPLDVNLQDLLKGDNSALVKLLNDALNNEGEVLDEDQRAQQNGKRAANGVKKPTRKPRPPRDPNAPTKPQNAFILYQKDIAHQVKAENPGKPWSEIVHLISTRWKALPKEEKEVYEHRFEEAKQRYEVENKIYMENKGQVVVAADPDGHEENNDTSESATAESQSTASQSDEEDEEDTPNPLTSRASRSKAKSSASAKNAPHPNLESSSKKRSKKRKPQEDDDNESAHEEEEHYELSKKLKKKNEEGADVQKDRKKSKKSSREEDKDLDMDEKSNKKRSKNKKKQD